MVDRTDKLTIRIAPEERAMLSAIAEADGVSASDVLRLFIRRTFAERFSDKKPSKPKK